ncbi:MAG: hypothetical protein GW949_04635 [Spirochaetales bacterium]|nr:hypothetical protein [Spirochaetales bacterium]
MKKFLKVFALFIGALVVLAVLGWILNLLPWAPGGYRKTNPLRVSTGSLPKIIPHGGAKLLYPENTIFSYQEMYSRGWTTFEIDLALTKDGVLVSHHDLDILSTTGVPGIKIADLDYEELYQYNFGSQFINLEGLTPYGNVTSENNPSMAGLLVPARLSDLFANYPDAFFILELKDTVVESGPERSNLAVKALITTITDYSMEDHIVMASFDSSLASQFRELTSNAIPTGAGTNDVLTFSVLSTLGLDFFLPTPYAGLFLPIRDPIGDSERGLIEVLPKFIQQGLAVYDEQEDTYYTNITNPRMVRDARRKNLSTYIWTVNDEETMRELIAMGVDGIITDRPDILENVLKDY